MIEELFDRFIALAMLSCPRSQPYWKLMGIPIEESEYTSLTLGSRRALGVVISRYEHMFAPNAKDLWDEFHSKSQELRILGSGYITGLLRKAGDLDQVLFEVMKDQGLIDPANLVAWIYEGFRMSSDPIMDIDEYITDRFGSMKGGDSDYVDQLLKFTIRLGFSKTWIETHFMIATQVLIMQRRNRWERFLGLIFGMHNEEGAPFWFEPIRYCIEYRRFQSRWSELRDTIGAASLLGLIDEMETDCDAGKAVPNRFSASDFARLRRLVVNSEARLTN